MDIIKIEIKSVETIYFSTVLKINIVFYILLSNTISW